MGIGMDANTFPTKQIVMAREEVKKTSFKDEQKDNINQY
jgi:hypothetical protein